MKVFSITLVISAITAIALTAIAGAHEQLGVRDADSQVFLNRDIGTLRFDKASAHFMFSYALIRAAVPGGVVDVSGCPNGSEPQYSFVFMDAKLRDVLGAIIDRVPDDRWTVENGVVDLLPANGSPALLTVRIGEFDSRNATTPNEAAGRLTELPEIKQAEKRLGLNNPLHIQLGLGVARKRGSATPKRRSPLSVRLRNITFLGALNALVRAKGNGVWTYREWHCDASNGYSITFSQ